MKKNLFYAAFALAMMASCTNEDNLGVEPVVPTPDTEDQVAINLGVNTPNIVASRGTGTVGGVQNETRDITGWDNQELKIVMVDADGDYAKEKISETATQYIFKDLTFNAPYKDATDSNIRIYKSEGLFQHKYYPVTGKFDFYGYHIDGITGYTETILPKTDSEAAIAKVTGININGSQDILAAQTEKIPTQAPTGTEQPYYNVAQDNQNIDWADMAKNQFSARTARNGFTPILNFEHQLARLKFYVRAGSNDTASKEWKNTAAEGESESYNWVDKAEDTSVTEGQSGYGMTNGAVYVTNISALHMTKTIDINLAGENGPITTPNASTTYGAFDLMSSPAEGATSKDLVTLVPVAAEYPWKSTNKPVDYQGTAIGEAMMFFPDTNIDTEGQAEKATDTEIILSIDLAQYLVDTEVENPDRTTGTKTYILKEQPDNLISLPASKIVGSTTQTSNLKFKAGESYNVYITIYGMERIEVSAQLTDWVDGGDVDLDIEDDKYPADEEETTTVTTKDVTVKVTGLPEGQTASVTVTPAEGSALPANANGSYTLNYGTTYTITATYEGYTATPVTLTAGESTAAEIEVAMTQNVQTPETKTLAISIQWPENTTDVENVLPVVKKQGEDTTVEPTKGKYSLEIGQTYTITVTHTGYTQQDYQTVTVSSETDDITVTMVAQG